METKNTTSKSPRAQARRSAGGSKRRLSRITRGLARAVVKVAERISPAWAAWLLYQVARHPPSRRVGPGAYAVLKTARRSTLRFNKHNVQIYIWGEVGPTVLCVHGWGGVAAQMTPFVQPLVDAGYRVVAFDAPGHGATGNKVSDPIEFSRAISAVVQTIGPVDTVIAHSLGAAATLLATRDGIVRPSRLVLLCGYARLDLVLEQMGWMFHASAPVLERTWDKLCGHYGTRADADELSPLVALRALDCPTFIVHDHDDTIVPIVHSEQLMAAAKNGLLVRTRGWGHHSILNAQVAQWCTKFMLDQRAALHHESPARSQASLSQVRMRA
jgi:pimeloyl-ACP methyl ester carboxylesterase